MSFIDQEQFLKQYTQKCPLCKQDYLKDQFAECKVCGKQQCLKCTVMAGKEGRYCLKCFKALPNERKEVVGKAAARLQFWAKKGYQIFLGFIIAIVLSFSLTFLYFPFFIAGIILSGLTIVFGYYMYQQLISDEESPDEQKLKSNVQ